MATTIATGKQSSLRAQRGFSLLEVVISMAVLTVGLISMLGVFGLAMAVTQDNQQDMIAKQLANEALESIVTARNTAQIQWDSIQNVSDGGIFMNSYQQLYTAGGDGILGTADDISGGQIQTLKTPGPDGIYGTADDTSVPLNQYQRQIVIQPVTDTNGVIVATLRAVNVTVKYDTPRTHTAKSYVLTSFISQYR